MEFILIEVGLNNHKKSYGYGYSEVPLFYEHASPSVEILRGTPRDVMKKRDDPGMILQKTGSILYFDCKEQVPKKFDQLFTLIPDNTLIGLNDELPGTA